MCSLLLFSVVRLIAADGERQFNSPSAFTDNRQWDVLNILQGGIQYIYFPEDSAENYYVKLKKKLKVENDIH